MLAPHVIVIFYPYSRIWDDVETVSKGLKKLNRFISCTVLLLAGNIVKIVNIQFIAGI